MKTLITVLIIASFIQSTIVSLNLVLIILLCRSYIRPDRANLFLAFAFGLVDGYLSLNVLGFSSILYLVWVLLILTLAKSPLAGNLLIGPLIFLILLANQQVYSFFVHQSAEIFPKIFWESLLALPIFYLTKIWEERFIVRREIKLRV